MTNVTYAITKTVYSLGSETRISYGIAAYSNTETDGTATIVDSVHDVTGDREKLSHLVRNCNRLQLSTLHLRDVVDDFLKD